MMFLCSGQSASHLQPHKSGLGWLCVATGHLETWAPVSGVTCDVWHSVTCDGDQPLCVTSEGNAATMVRWPGHVSLIQSHAPPAHPHHPRACSRISDAGTWMSGHGQMQTVQKWLKLHWLRIKFGMSFIIHIFLTIVFHCIKIIDSVICCKRIFYMLLDYGDYQLWHLTILAYFVTNLNK